MILLSDDLGAENGSYPKNKIEITCSSLSRFLISLKLSSPLVRALFYLFSRQHQTPSH